MNFGKDVTVLDTLDEKERMAIKTYKDQIKQLEGEVAGIREDLKTAFYHTVYQTGVSEPRAHLRVIEDVDDSKRAAEELLCAIKFTEKALDAAVDESLANSEYVESPKGTPAGKLFGSSSNSKNEKAKADYADRLQKIRETDIALLRNPQIKNLQWVLTTARSSLYGHGLEKTRAYELITKGTEKANALNEEINVLDDRLFEAGRVFAPANKYGK